MMRACRWLLLTITIASLFVTSNALSCISFFAGAFKNTGAPAGNFIDDPQKHEARKYEARVAKLVTKYGLEIVYKKRAQSPIASQHKGIDWTEPSHHDLVTYLPILDQELNRYPVNLITFSGVKRIVLCQILQYDDHAVAGLAAYADDTIYLKANSNTLAYQRRAIHHELFHMLDYRNGTLHIDGSWQRFSENWGRFGWSGHSLQSDLNAVTMRDDLPGFLNKYSTSGVCEDKAEIFANLMVRGNFVAERANRDPIIAAKVRMMRETCKKWCPNLQESFWGPSATD